MGTKPERREGPFIWSLGVKQRRNSHESDFSGHRRFQLECSSFHYTEVSGCGAIKVEWDIISGRKVKANTSWKSQTQVSGGFEAQLIWQPIPTFPSTLYSGQFVSMSSSTNGLKSPWYLTCFLLVPYQLLQCCVPFEQSTNIYGKSSRCLNTWNRHKQCIAAFRLEGLKRKRSLKIIPPYSERNPIFELLVSFSWLFFNKPILWICLPMRWNSRLTEV